MRSAGASRVVLRLLLVLGCVLGLGVGTTGGAHAAWHLSVGTLAPVHHHHHGSGGGSTSVSGEDTAVPRRRRARVRGTVSALAWLLDRSARGSRFVRSLVRTAPRPVRSSWVRPTTTRLALLCVTRT